MEILLVVLIVVLAVQAAAFVLAATRIERTSARIEHTAELGRQRADRQDAALRTTLARMEQAASVVATNLAHSIQRADDAEGAEGAAADAALRSAQE